MKRNKNKALARKKRGAHDIRFIRHALPYMKPVIIKPWDGPKRVCGAKTRKGTTCKMKDVYHGGRCRFHGGLSTGPKTTAGKARSALNGFCPKRKRTP